MDLKFTCVCSRSFDRLTDLIKCCAGNHGFGHSQLRTECEVIAEKLIKIPMIKQFCNQCHNMLVITSEKDLNSITSCSNCDAPLLTTKEREEIKLLLSK